MAVARTSLHLGKDMLPLQNYLLVLQWRGEFQPTYDELIAIEGALMDHLGDSGDVDGHDVGSDESNIFIFTDAPEHCLHVALILVEPPHRECMVAGVRPANGDGYTAIWPPELDGFAIS